MNPLNLIDAYKIDHRRQYPDGVSCVFSNFTPRSSRIDGVNAIVFFGLQYFVKKYLIKDWNDNFFSRPKAEVVARYKRRIDNVIGKDCITLEHIEQLHDIGYLPIQIMALPEGSRVSIKVPPLVIFNTRPEAFWLTNYLETILSCTLWQPCTSATIANEYRKLFDSYAAETGGDLSFTQFQGHDFSFRGMSSLESACLSGAGHLLSFSGTDTLPAIDFLEEYYGADSDKELVGVSVPASEHSTMSMGNKDNEIDTYRRLLSLYPTGIVSVVSDTWDYWNVLTHILPQLKNEIMARNGKLVIRPDSSPKTPLEIICGDLDAPENSPERKGSIQILWDLFGGTINEKGFKQLDSHIGLIYGDSITLTLARNINQRLMDMGFVSTNWVAGIGSFTYQYNTRDTFGFAMKATYGTVNGEPREIFKSPKTDSGVKVSARGLVAAYQDRDGVFYLKDRASWLNVNSCNYEVVFVDGELIRKHTLKEIRERLLNS